MYGTALVAISTTKFITIGGAISSSSYLDTVFSYDTEADTWSQRANLPYDMYSTNCIRTVFRSRDSVVCFFNNG